MFLPALGVPEYADLYELFGVVFELDCNEFRPHDEDVDGVEERILVSFFVGFDVGFFHVEDAELVFRIRHQCCAD